MNLRQENNSLLTQWHRTIVVVTAVIPSWLPLARMKERTTCTLFPPAKVCKRASQVSTNIDVISMNTSGETLELHKTINIDVSPVQITRLI